MDVRVLSRPLVSGFRTTVIPEGSWEEVEACQICGRSTMVRDVAIVDDGAPAGVVAACLACEFVFFRRRPTPAWFEAFYAGEWDFGRRNANGSLLPVPAVSRVFDFCAPHLAGHERVFEIGAGLGGSLLAFARAGYAVAAVEPSRHRAKFITGVMGLPCINLPIEESPRSETFDLVYLNHVLEHLFDPARVIALAAGMVRRGGYLYVAVPNLWNECAAQAVHYVPHLSTFTERSLRRLLAGHGFQVIRVELQHDIQLVARRSDAVEEQVAGTPTEFWSRLSHLMAQGFGGAPGRHGLVWFPVGDHEYRRFTVSRTELVGLQLGVRMASRLPRSLSRLTPALLRRRVRALDVLLSGDMALPMTIAHSAAGQGAWTK